MTTIRLFSLLALTALLASPVGAAVRVVTTLSAYAAIAQAVGGDRVEVSSISSGNEDAHFVKPKPSLALMLKDADLFVTTGLDLELWAPVLVDKSGNRRIRESEPGYVSASAGITLRDIPASASREAGDVHIYGNPHVHTSPLEAKLIAANIAAGLERVDAEGAEVYRRRLEAFQGAIDRALYGAELVSILGSDTLDPLARQGKLVAFLEANEYEGEPLVGRLGGWLGRARAFRGREILAYHKNWVYLTDLLGLEVIEYVERKPGIPPSARHVKNLIDLISEREIGVLVSASYFDPKKPELIAERTGCRSVILPLGPDAVGGGSYVDLIDSWISALEAVFVQGATG